MDEFVKKSGKQVTKKDTIPGAGDFCYCMDTEGNLLGILHPLIDQLVIGGDAP